MIIFGGTGFIGSQYKELYPGWTGNLVIHRDENTIPRADDVLYLISTVDNYNVFTNPTLDVETNLLKLMQILPNIARKIKGTKYVFNFVSSWFVYGQRDNAQRFKEDDVCSPKGFYSITKKCAEDLVESYCKTHNVKYRILRLGNVYGVTDKKASAKKNALNFLLDKINRNDPISLYNGGHFYRDYTHVSDICAGINLVCNSGKFNEIYNIATGKSHRFLDIIMSAILMSNSTSVITSIEPTDFHKQVQVKDCFMNTAKIESLGFKPLYNVIDHPFK